MFKNLGKNVKRTKFDILKKGRWLHAIIAYTIIVIQAFLEQPSILPTTLFSWVKFWAPLPPPPPFGKISKPQPLKRGKGGGGEGVPLWFKFKKSFMAYIYGWSSTDSLLQTLKAITRRQFYFVPQIPREFFRATFRSIQQF